MCTVKDKKKFELKPSERMETIKEKETIRGEEESKYEESSG
jgi:hypothetical protein